MSWGLAAARVLGGYAQGMQAEDERARVARERAEMKAAAALKEKLEQERQTKLDAQNAEQTAFQNRMKLADQTRQMGAAGYAAYQPGMIDGATEQVATAARAGQDGAFGGVAGIASDALRARGAQQASALAASQGGYLRTAMSDQERIREDERQARAAAQQASLAQQATLARERMAAEQQRAQETNETRRMIAASGRSGQKAAPLRVVPAGTVQDFNGIQANIRELAELESLATSDPKAFSEALGLKNMLPEWLATRGMSEAAITARGRLSNVGSGVFLERSGAAVTPSEAKRLEGWTANLTDNPTKARVAIRNMRAFFEQKAADMQNAYGEPSGYRPITPAAAPDGRADSAPKTTVPARRQGESIADYRKRTGGR